MYCFSNQVVLLFITMKNIISIDQFSKIQLDNIFISAWNLQKNDWKLFPPGKDQFFVEQNDIMYGHTMASLFYEPSTRTRLSFETAFSKLGGHVVSVENAFDNSSCKKGENYLDTVRAVSEIVDVIVFRHPENDSALKAAEVASCPIINAGDGSGEHPSQAVIDFYTIWKEKKTLDGLNLAIVGDLKYARTINSLKKMAQIYNIPVSEYDLSENPDLSQADVVYMTRVQLERRTETVCNTSVEPLNPNLLKEDAIILHPLPRGPELPATVDSDPRACYWKQVKNSVPVRQSLFLHSFGVA